MKIVTNAGFVTGWQIFANNVETGRINKVGALFWTPQGIGKDNASLIGKEKLEEYNRRIFIGPTYVFVRVEEAQAVELFQVVEN